MLLIDTDMLVLLAASGLLERVVVQLGYTMQEVRRLPASIHQIRKSRSLRNQYGAVVLERALPLVEAIEEVGAARDQALLDQLNAVMDAGEAQLTALAVEHHGSLLVSGDKRALRGLMNCADPVLLQAMQGRIVTLEAALWLLLRDSPVSELRDALQIAPLHATLRIVFSEVNLSSADGCESAVSSYLANLKTEFGDLLYNLNG